MKKSQFNIAATLDISPEAAWDVIGAVKGVDQWLAPITACRVEGNKRFCTTEGGEFSEDILKIDHENRVFKYAIPTQHVVPVENIVGQMEVHTTDDGKAQVKWSWNYEVEEANDVQAQEVFGMMGNMGLQGIEAFVKQNAQAVV